MLLNVEAIPETLYYWVCQCGKKNIVGATVLNRYGSCMDECDRCGKVVNVMKTKGVMTLDEYQTIAQSTNSYTDVRDLCLGLASEAGEVAGKISKTYRDNGGVVDHARIKEIALETGDLLWYVATISEWFDMRLSVIADMNVDKLASRKRRGVLGGSGDNR